MMHFFKVYTRKQDGKAPSLNYDDKAFLYHRVSILIKSIIVWNHTKHSNTSNTDPQKLIQGTFKSIKIIKCYKSSINAWVY